MAPLRSSPHAKKLHSSPRNSPRTPRESPSRQSELNLERTFANVRLHDQESQKLYIYHRKAVQDELDAKEYAQALVHKAGIDDALAKHEIVRQQAVAVLETHIREEEERRRREEEERRRKEAEERRRAEEERRLREENERKAREAREKAEAAKRMAEERARAEQEERERRQREDTAKREQEAKDKAEADAEAEVAATKKKEESDAKAAAEKNAASRIAAAQAAGSSDPSLPWSSNLEVRHKHYLDIHQRLKKFRKEFVAAAKKDPNLKPIIGDMRRAIRTATSQPSIYDKKTNKVISDKITDYLLRAKNQIPSPPVILNEYLPPHLNLLDKNTTTIPALLLYLINIFSKSLIASFISECSAKPLAADPFGTLAVQVFSNPELQFQRNVPSANSGLHYDRFGGQHPTPPMAPSSVNLISILMAKYHAVAPILFGVSGSETTQQGRIRLGWRKEEGAFVPSAKHYDRLIGLAAGYAAISLRNFSKSKLKNPCPPIHFWECLSSIINTPAGQVQVSHILLLKTLLEVGSDRFILFFGSDAVAALRLAVIEFPKTFPAELASRPEARSLPMIADAWRREKNFNLA